jgi:hypothetical protein
MLSAALDEARPCASMLTDDAIRDSGSKNLADDATVRPCPSEYDRLLIDSR